MVIVRLQVTISGKGHKSVTSCFSKKGKLPFYCLSISKYLYYLRNLQFRESKGKFLGKSKMNIMLRFSRILTNFHEMEVTNSRIVNNVMKLNKFSLR